MMDIFKTFEKFSVTCSVKWYMHTSADGLLTLAAEFSPTDILQIVFTTCPTYVAFLNTDAYQLVLQTDGVISFLCKMDKNDNAGLNGFKFVPPNYRYGAYIVYDNAVFYKKDYWHYPSVNYEKNEKPVMRNLTPRPSVLYRFNL